MKNEPMQEIIIGPKGTLAQFQPRCRPELVAG